MTSDRELVAFVLFLLLFGGGLVWSLHEGAARTEECWRQRCPTELRPRMVDGACFCVEVPR